MRTLFEILESAKDGDKPTHDECYDPYSDFERPILEALGLADRNVRSLTLEVGAGKMPTVTIVEYITDEATGEQFREILSRYTLKPSSPE